MLINFVYTMYQTISKILLYYSNIHNVTAKHLNKIINGGIVVLSLINRSNEISDSSDFVGTRTILNIIEY